MMARETMKRQRSCISCGKQESKGALRRMVRSSEGVVSYDPSGRAPGRGAYVCSDACFAAAAKARKLDRALRCKLTEDDYMRIADALASDCGAELGKTEE